MQNLLPGVPPIHSPFFDEILAGSGWDAETRRVAQDLHRDGYAVLDFQEPALDRLAADIQARVFSEEGWAKWRSGETPDVRVADAWQSNESVRTVAANAHMRDLLSRIYGREAFPFQTLNFAVGSQQPAHHDLVHFASMPENFMCGVWLALEDIQEGAGPLIYYPGSHRWPVYLNEHIGRSPAPSEDPYEDHAKFEAVWAKLREHYQARPVVFHPRKGQALIWTANLHHGGSPQADKAKTRHSQVTHYMFKGCAYWTPLVSNPFAGRIGFRTGIVDVSTGERVPHEVAGQPVTEAFMRATSPDPAPAPVPSLVDRIRRRARRLLDRSA